MFNVNEVVYLRESAALGFLEAVRISTVIQERTGVFFEVNFNAKSPQVPSIFGDRNQLSSGVKVRFVESELVTLCEALGLARDYLTGRLADIEAQIARRCP